MKQLKITLVLLALLALFIPGPASASQVQDQLKASIDQILNVLKDPQYKGEDQLQARRETLRTIIYERFSFKKMAQLSLGKEWKKRTDEEKEQFSKLFSQLLEDTYVSKIEAYTNEKVVFTKEMIKKKKAQVNTKIITDSVEIPIDYRMYKTKDGSWMVYDMVIEGVSLVGNYRSQFSQILQKDTFDVLVKELEKKLSS